MEPYDQYDYDRNHPQLEVDQQEAAGLERAIRDTEAVSYPSANDYTSDPEEAELPPYATSPHICYSSHLSTTTCKITFCKFVPRTDS